VFISCSCLLACSCQSIETSNQDLATKKPGARPKHVQKPPAAFQDTLIIKSQAAVFYYPDSIQILKIKDSLDSSVYKGIMHSYFYQLRNAHIVLNKLWPKLKIYDAKKFRYLLFIEKDADNFCIDLNKKNELYGLIVFSKKKQPEDVDMTNLETQISFYLKE
jgi:hypothetical protein